MSGKYPDKVVLVVDNEFILREGTESYMRRALGCKTIGFCSAEEAISFIDKGEKIDAAIIDHSLRKGDLPSHSLTSYLKRMKGDDFLILMQSGVVDIEEIGYPVSSEKPDSFYLGKPTGIYHAAGADRARLDKLAKAGEQAIRRRSKPSSVDAIYNREEEEKMVEVLDNYFSGKGKPELEQIER